MGYCFPVFGRGESTNHESHQPAREMSNRAKKSKPKRVATYTRMSENQPHLSLAGQMALIRNYAKRRGLKIVKSYSGGAKGGGQT